MVIVSSKPSPRTGSCKPEKSRCLTRVWSFDHLVHLREPFKLVRNLIFAVVEGPFVAITLHHFGPAIRIRFACDSYKSVGMRMSEPKGKTSRYSCLCRGG